MGQYENHFSRKEKVFGQFFTPLPVADFMVRLDKKESSILHHV